MRNNLEWAVRLAEQHAQQASRNYLWREHYAATLPPGRERRSKLWLMTYYARRNEQRAQFWQRLVASCGSCAA